MPRTIVAATKPLFVSSGSSSVGGTEAVGSEGEPVVVGVPVGVGGDSVGVVGVPVGVGGDSVDDVVGVPVGVTVVSVVVVVSSSSNLQMITELIFLKSL